MRHPDAHLTDAELEAFIDHEPSVDRAGVERHATSCAVCVARLARARVEAAELSQLLRSADHATPRAGAGTIIARARARSARRSALIAAAALLTVATAAAAAVPGSPLNRYVVSLLARRAPAAAPAHAEASANNAASRGIAFIPGDQVDVDFRATQSQGAVQVRLADVRSVLLTQTDTHGDAHYSLTPSGVTVDNGGSTASYALVLPRTLMRARVRVAGEIVLAKDGDMVACVESRDSAGTCVVGLKREPRASRK